MKVCIGGPGHITKIAAMPIFRKDLEKSLQNQKPMSLKLRINYCDEFV